MRSDNTTSNGKDQEHSGKQLNNESQDSDDYGNVVNLFTGQNIESPQVTRILCIYAETHGARMLYSSYDNPERLIAVPVLCWALLEDGAVVGMVPWLDEILPCEEIEDNFSINWEGYYCPQIEDFFFEPPAEAVAQLATAARFNAKTINQSRRRCGKAESGEQKTWVITQEIPDPVGTHALLFNQNNDSLVLTSVISWVLDDSGQLHGMLADDANIEKLPVLPGDDCLFCAEEDEHFKCYFQRDIAEQIRTQNPETMQAIEQLFGN